MAAQKFFAAIGNETGATIYGIGQTEEAAVEDALDGAGYQDMESLLEDGNSGFTAKPMAERYYYHVKEFGFDGMSDIWTERNGLVDFDRSDLVDYIEKIIENTAPAELFGMLENGSGAEFTNRLIPGDENFEYPEWSEDAEIDGVPVKVAYRTTPEDQALVDETGDWGDINWSMRLESVIVDCDQIDD
jgi:hypothetical protein